MLGRLSCTCKLPTPIVTQSITKNFRALPRSFFARPAEVVGPELVGCRLVKRQSDGGLLWGVIVETEAYDRAATACSVVVHFVNIACCRVFFGY